MRHQPGQHVDGSFAKARPFTTEPLLEGLLADVDTVQQIFRRRVQRPVRGYFGASREASTLKLGDVDLDGLTD